MYFFDLPITMSHQAPNSFSSKPQRRLRLNDMLLLLLLLSLLLPKPLRARWKMTASTQPRPLLRQPRAS